MDRAWNIIQVGARTFEIILEEGRNRQIRKMCEALGYVVQVLHRTQVAGITLSGLNPGQWANLAEEELRVVRQVLSDAGESVT